MKKGMGNYINVFLILVNFKISFGYVLEDLVGLDCIDRPDIYKIAINVQAANKVIDSLVIAYNDSIPTRKELEQPIDPKENRQNALASFIGTIFTEMNEDLFLRRVQFEPKIEDNFDSPESETIIDKSCSSPNAFDQKATMALSYLLNVNNGEIGGNIIISYCIENHGNVMYVIRKNGNCGFLILVKWNGIEETSVMIKKAILEVVSSYKNAVDDVGRTILEDKRELCYWAGNCIGHIYRKIGHIVQSNVPLTYVNHPF